MRLLLSCFMGCVATVALGQPPLEGRPAQFEKKQLTREELELGEAEKLSRQARTLFGLGVMRERADRILDALKHYEEALKLDPDSLIIRRAIIPTYLLLNRDAEAQSACKFILERDPNDYDTAFKLAILQKLIRDLPASINSLNLALKSNRIKDRFEKQLVIRMKLAEFLREMGYVQFEIANLAKIAELIDTHQRDLVLSTEFTEKELIKLAIESREKLGKCLLQLKNIDEAAQAFLGVRNLMRNHPDVASKNDVHRIDWHLCEIATAQQKWKEALGYVEEYLKQMPLALEGYERKIELLRHLERDRDILPAAKAWSEGDPHHVGLQLLYARELGRDGKNQAEAERVYRTLAANYTKPDVYRGWFKFYHTAGRMEQVLNILDETFGAINDKDRDADAREAASTKWRAMMVALREDRELVTALLNSASSELRNLQFNRRRKLDIWQFLAGLAASTRQLDKAELFYRQCLELAASFQKDDIYEGLLEVLRLSHKWDEMIEICTKQLAIKRKDKGAIEIVFRHHLAIALGQTGKPKEAVKYFDEAADTAPSDGWKLRIREDKARMLCFNMRDSEAFAECEKLLKEFRLPSEQKAVRVAYSSLLEMAGRHDDAERQLLLVLEDEPNDALANNNLGYHWAERNQKLDEAEKRIRRALETDRQNKLRDSEDDNAAYLDSLGWVLFRKGEIAEARKSLEKASRLPYGSEDGTVWDHLGDVYFKQRENTLAREAWEKAQKLFEHDARAKREGRIEEVKRKLEGVK